MGPGGRARIARIRRWLRNSCSRKTASSYNREPARPSAGRHTVTDDYDFRASERRRARELDELEARRLRARERQRAQLRAAHRRRRLTVLGVLGLMVGVASGAWVWTSGTPKSRTPIVPANTVAAPAKKVTRTMPAFTRGVHVSSPWAAQSGNLDRVLATSGLNLLQLDVKDEGGEVSGLGSRTPALAQRVGASATTTTSRTSRGSRTTATSGSSRASSASRIRSSRRHGPSSRSATSTAASGRTAAACRGSTSTTPPRGST